MATTSGVDESELTAPLADPEFYAADPFPLYARLRAEAPVARNEALGFWAVSRHADVITVSRDPETFCSGRGILTMEIGAEYATPPTMMHTDPPDHTRYRNLVQPGFRPTFMRALEDGIRARTRALVDVIEPGTPVDIVSDLAVPLPAPGHQRPAGRARGGVAAVLPVVRGGHPRRHRLARGGAQRPQRRDGHLPAGGGGRPPGQSPGRHHLRARRSRGRRRPADRRRARACSWSSCWWPATRPPAT